MNLQLAIFTKVKYIIGLLMINFELFSISKINWDDLFTKSENATKIYAIYLPKTLK
jgi:hypothetical protein